MMRKNVKSALRLVVAIALFIPLSLFAQTKYSGGTGTQANPYKISSITDLVSLSNDVRNSTDEEPCAKQYFILTKDLDFSSDADKVDNFTPIGDNAKAFFGNFDGQGYTISNLVINNSTDSRVALFGTFVQSTKTGTVTAEIKNLGLINPTITATKSTAWLRAACLVGYLQNNATISNCYVQNGTITVTNGQSPTHIGGILAYNCASSNVTNCCVEGLAITSNISTSQGASIGGIVGDNDGGGGNTTTVTMGFSDNCTCNGEAVSSVGEVVGNSSNVGNVYPPVGETTNPTDEQKQMIIQSMIDNSNGTLMADDYGINGGLPVNEEQYNTAKANAESGATYTLWVGRWNFVGSIGSTFDYFNSNGNSLGNDIAAIGWDYTTNNWNSTYYYASDAMQQGSGYFVYPFPNKVLTQEQIDAGKTSGDALTNTTITYKPSALKTSGSWTIAEIENTGDDSGPSTKGKWFLFSNPFNKPIAVSTINSSLSNLQGASKNVLVYNSKDKKWDTPDNILPGQGFAVAATENGGKYTVSGTIAYPSKKDATVQTQEPITFTCIQGYNKKNMYAAMNENYSNSFDKGDSYIMFSTENAGLVEPYFVQDSRDLLFNMFKSLPYVCDVNFHANQDHQAALFVTNIPENISVSIIDLSADASETVLNEGDTFTFTAYTGENTGRYKIKFSKNNNVSITETESIANEIDIYNDNKEVFINGSNLKNVTVVNTLGQTVYSKNIGGETYSCYLNVNSGAYIVKVQTANGTQTKKIIIK